MGSGSVKKALIMSFVMVLVVLAAVMAVNRDRLGNSGQKAVTQTEETADTMASGQVGSHLSAFMKDKSFFDKESSQDVTMQYGRKVSLVMNSVDQDLRVMVVDEIGKLVTGAAFKIDIAGQGTYTDDDKDGVIYIAHLRPGSYDVTLDQLKGYLISDSRTTIQVRRELEYTVLGNIEYLIVNADQVDAAKDDTEKKDAKSDADSSENDTLGSENGTAGIDVSSWNRKIDWSKVSGSGAGFAVIRCGYRGASSGKLVEDSEFEDNITGAQMNGISTGVYFYSQAITEAEAVEEASMVCSLIDKYQIDLPVYIDSEGTSDGNGRADGLDTQDRTRVVLAFLKTVKNAGHEAGLYASAKWLKNHLDAAQLSDFHIWLAQYREAPDYDGTYDMWQYSSGGSVDGIDTKVDLDSSYIDDKNTDTGNKNNN